MLLLQRRKNKIIVKVDNNGDNLACLLTLFQTLRSYLNHFNSHFVLFSICFIKKQTIFN